MKLSEMFASKSDAELGAMFRDRHTRLMDAHSMGLSDEAPHETWNAQNKILRDHKISKDAAGSGLGARELEERDQPNGAQDDPPPTPGTPRSPERSAAAMDAVIPGYSRLLHRNNDSRVVDEDRVVQPRRRR